MRALKRWLRLLRGDANIPYLKKRGLTMGRGCSIQPQCIIDPSHCWLISIGNNVTMAPRVHILAHDASTKRALGYTKIGLVSVGDDVYIGASSVVLPGVQIGNGAIIGAHAVVSHDIPEGCVAVGNPAKVIGMTADYYAKQKEFLADCESVFGSEYTIGRGITTERKAHMIERLKRSGGNGFVR